MNKLIPQSAIVWQIEGNSVPGKDNDQYPTTDTGVIEIHCYTL